MSKLSQKEIEMCNSWDAMSDEEFDELLQACGVIKLKNPQIVNWMSKDNNFKGTGIVEINISQNISNFNKLPFLGQSSKKVYKNDKNILLRLKEAS